MQKEGPSLLEYIVVILMTLLLVPVAIYKAIIEKQKQGDSKDGDA